MSDTIYVIGSGKTIDYIDPAFFDGKNVIAVNEAAERLGLYNNRVAKLITFSHYHEETFRLAEKYPRFVFHTPMGDRGFDGEPVVRQRNVVFWSHYPTHFDFDPSKGWPTDGILVGSTSVHGAMHVACRMGAKFIVLCGVDCGFLDGEANQAGYQSGNLASGDVSNWLARWEMHLRLVKQKLEQEYPVRIYSLNPFLNLNLEGHEWTKPALSGTRLCKVCGMHCADLH